MSVRTLIAALLVGLVSCTPRAADPKPPAPEALTPGLSSADIDAQLRAAWTEKKITPAAAIDDAGFLRRVTLDLTGTLPTPEAIRAFLADGSPDKRAKAVDALLASPAYADHWTDYWDQVLIGPRVPGQVVDHGAFRRWLHGEFEHNAPWNQLVFDLVSASGQNSLGGQEAKRASTFSATDAALRAQEVQAGVNGAVNWELKFKDSPQDLAGAVSKTFLGVQIQCAQCHDHKTEKWKQADFQAFTASFARTKVVPMERGKVMGVRQVELRDEDRIVMGGKKAPPEVKAIARMRPAALDGTPLDMGRVPRRQLAGWIVAPQNPWFATALVNRLWARLLGRGFVEPMDDLRPSNPAVLPGLLRQLANDFSDHGYDLKRLLHTICLTEAYQRVASAAGESDTDLWAHARLRPLGADDLLNALFAATQIPAAAQEAGVENVEEVRAKILQGFVFLFDVDEEDDTDTFNGTIPQALLELNGQIFNRSVRPMTGTTLAQVMAMPGGDDAKITELYLRSLSRLPTSSELTRWNTYVNSNDLTAENNKGPKNGDPLRALNQQRLRDRGPKIQAYEDLFWALLSSSEFAFNH